VGRFVCWDSLCLLINNKIFLFFAFCALPSLCDSETTSHENSLERSFGLECGGDNRWHGVVDWMDWEFGF